MNTNEEGKNTSMIFSMGREGTNVYNNFQEGMPCDYDLKDESSFDECHTVIESVIDDDKACIEKLLSHKEAKKKRNKGYIMPQKPAGTGVYYGYNQNSRHERLCAKIKHLCRNNFDNTNAMHVMLSFDAKRFPQKNFTDLKTAKEEFRKFIERMRGHYDNFRHVTTFARHKNGNWHFHMLCNLDVNTKQKFIREIWGLGIVKIVHKSNAGAFKNLVSYLCKNMKKNFDEFLGVRAVLYSQELQDNLKLMSWKTEDYFIIDRMIQHFERENIRPYGKDGRYYISASIAEYWDTIVMATPKKTKFKHKKYRPRKKSKKGGDANGVKSSGEGS